MSENIDNSQNDLKSNAASHNDSNDFTKDVSPLDNVDMESDSEAISPGLSQEEINSRRATIRDKKTFGANLSRVMSQGHTRLIMFGGFGLLLVGGVAASQFIGSDKEITDANATVSVPPNLQNVSGEATLTPEQAEYERKKQQQLAEQASENGQTYVPSVIVERDIATEQYLSDKTVVPGGNQRVDAYGRPIRTAEYKDTDIPTSALTTQASGDMIVAKEQAMNNGYNQSNAGYSNNQNSTNNQSATPNQTVNTQPVSTVPTGKYASQISALNDTKNGIEQWGQATIEGYKRRAAQTEESAQVAFTEQLKNLVSAKPKLQSTVAEANRYQAYRYLREDKKGQNEANDSNKNQYGVPDKDGKLNNKSGSSVTSQISEQGPVIIRAGTAYTAQLISQVNTDQGNEVLARVTDGPFKGAQLIGSVKNTGQNIGFGFSRLIPVKGTYGDYLSISAVGRTIGTNGLGMADQIKKHTVSRYTALVASSALSGYGEAYRDIGTSYLNNNGTLVQVKQKPNDHEIAGNIVGEIGQTISNDISKQASRPITFIANTGKVFKVYFNENVTQKN